LDPVPNARTELAVNLDGDLPQDTGSRLICQTLNSIRGLGFPAGQTGDMFSSSVIPHRSMWQYITVSTNQNAYTPVHPQPFTQGDYVDGTAPLVNPLSATWNSDFPWNGLAFDQFGNLYNPITLNGGDPIATSGFVNP